MPTKLILIALMFLFISLYLIFITDMYLLSPVQREDVMMNLQTLTGQHLTGTTRSALVTSQSGERIAVSADTEIVFKQAVPLTIYHTPILHKPVGITFAQNDTLQHLDALYLTQSYKTCSALFMLAIIQIICLLRWSKGKHIKEVYLYVLVILFASLLCFQYLR